MYYHFGQILPARFLRYVFSINYIRISEHPLLNNSDGTIRMQESNSIRFFSRIVAVSIRILCTRYSMLGDQYSGLGYDVNWQFSSSGFN